MRFFNINIEGPDCSGKTTLYNKLHQATNYQYNIQDRSCMSMFVYAKMYERDNTSIWFDKILDDLKRLDTLYIIMLPSESVLLERLKIRGDELQDEISVLEVRNHFRNLASLQHLLLHHLGVFHSTKPVSSLLSKHTKTSEKYPKTSAKTPENVRKASEPRPKTSENV